MTDLIFNPTEIFNLEDSIAAELSRLDIGRDCDEERGLRALYSHYLSTKKEPSSVVIEVTDGENYCSCDGYELLRGLKKLTTGEVNLDRESRRNVWRFLHWYSLEQ